MHTCTKNKNMEKQNIYQTENCPSLDGTSWDTAYSALQDCLDDVEENKPSNVEQGEIWVAKGTYTPDTYPSWAQGTHAEFYSFLMYPNISLYGGFDGSETDRNDRNWFENPTILSCNVTDNLNHACSMILISEMNCLIDGFIFTDAREFTVLEGRRRRRERRRLNEYSYDDMYEVLTDVDSGLGGGIKSNGTNVKVANCLFTNIEAFKGYV